MSPAAATRGNDAGGRSPLTAVAREALSVDCADACGTLSTRPTSSTATAAVTEGRRIDPFPGSGSRLDTASAAGLRSCFARALRYRKRSGHTVRRARVERVAARRAERPVVARRVQRQEQRPEAPRLLPVLAVGDAAGNAELLRADPARADDVLPDPVLRIGHAVRVLRGEPLVIVVVPVQHDVGVRGVEGLPEGLVGRVPAVKAR